MLKTDALFPLEKFDKPANRRSANATHFDLGAGLPVKSPNRLASFMADEFERFALE